MPSPKLTKLELQFMEALWSRGALSIREISGGFSRKEQTRILHYPDHSS